MFEKLIEQLILKYLGDYIEGFDPTKLSLALWSGTISLEKINLKAKAIDELKLPFKLIFGLIDKLSVSISWKTNFSEPTEITIEGLYIVLSLVDTKDWEHIDYTSFGSKLEQLIKYSKVKMEKLMQAFNEVSSEEQKGYTDKIFVKIVDNLQFTIKNLFIRIEDKNISPYYSMGLVLKEVKVINTDKNWESHFIDRTVEKNTIIYKFLSIKDFGIYLKLNEEIFISKLENPEEKLTKLLEACEDNNLKGHYLIEPYNLSMKMQQMNDEFENLTEEEKKLPKLSLFIELPKFKINFRKEQYNTIFRVLNQITQYKKIQKIYYDMRKYNYFKPRYRILDKAHKENILKELPEGKNENAFLWFKFGINMTLKTLKYYKGDKNIFNIPNDIIEQYKEKFIELYTKYHKKLEENKDYKIEVEEDEYLLKKIMSCIDIELLCTWSDKIIEQDFKDKKIEEKKSKNSGGYFSFFFGFGAKQEEPIFTEEEEKKLAEILKENNKKKEKDPEDLKREDLFVEFKLIEGSMECSKNIESKTMKINEGFELNFRGVEFTMSNNTPLQILKINSNLKHFGMNMFTIVNNTINTVPITYRYLNTTSKTNKFTEIFLNNKNENEENLITFKFSYTPLTEVNSTIDLKLNCINLIYHQTFISRVMRFFTTKGQFEDLKNNVMESYKSFKQQTESMVKSNITKKNNIKVEISPRKILIPINKYDIKNSKMLVWEMGQGGIDTTNNKLEINDPKNIYNKHYTVDLGAISLRCFENVKKMVKNKHSFDLLKDIKLIVTLSSLNKKKFSSHDYPLMKLVFSVDNLDLHLTEYLYHIMFYLNKITSPTYEKDVWSQLNLEKKDIAKNKKAISVLLKKDWFTGYYEKYLGVLSGGYIYFYKSSEDDEYNGYYYLKDSEVKSSLDSLIINISNDSGSIELKFPNKNKFKLWDRCLKERIEEMKFSYEDKSKEITEEMNKKKIDPEEMYFRTEVIFKSFNVFLYTNDDINDMKNKIHVFTLSVNEMNVSLTLRSHDTKACISMLGLKLYDVQNEIKDFQLIAYSGDEINKEVKLFNMEILLLDAKSPSYTNFQMGINLNIGYLHFTWVPDSIRRFLFFIMYNNFIKARLEKELRDPNEKLVEQKFIAPKLDNDFYPTCDKNNYIYMKIHANFKKVNFILVQPILKIFYHEVKMGESSIDFDIYTDHSFIKGSLGNTQIYDLCEYPFVISSQDKYDPSKKVEIFGLKKEENDNNDIQDNEMIYFTYYNFNEYCPKFKDNYGGISEVKINKVFLVYTQEQFLRFLNYFLTEFLGAMIKPDIKEEEKDLKHLEEMNPVNEDNIKDENLDEGEEKKFTLIIEENKNEISTSSNKEQNNKEEDKNEISTSSNQEQDNKEENKDENKKEIKSEEKKEENNNEIKLEEKKEENNNEKYNDKNEINEEKEEKEENKESEINTNKDILSENSGNNNQPKSVINLLSNEEIKSEKKATIKVKDEREIRFIKLNININSPQLILKPRPSFSDYFVAELGKINIQAFYQKVTGKVYKDPNDWRWLTTYQMRLTNCYILRNDGFEILSKTNGIVNMHFTYNTESDLLLLPNEIDKSFQFDVYFNEFLLNLRQIDYLLLLQCNDLNILYTDDQVNMYDYNKYKMHKDLSKVNTSKSEFNVTVNSNEISSINLINNNKEKIDLSKYMNMFITFFVNRVKLNLFFDDKRELSQLLLDEFFLIFKQKLDYSSVMGIYVRNLEVFASTENNDKEVIVSDFSQLINQYEESDNDSQERRRKCTNSISNGSSGSKDQSSGDVEEIMQTLNINNEQKKDSFILNEIKNIINTNKDKINRKRNLKNRKISHYKKKLVDLSGFGYFIVKKIQKCEIIDVTDEEKEEGEETINKNKKENNEANEEIKDFISNYQLYGRLKINTKHDKFINIKLVGLKFLIRIDKIFLLQAFFVDGMPFYDPEDKNLPNLFEDNEENFPAIKFEVEFLKPLICLLSDSLKNSEQETCCIKSEIKFYLHKEKISDLKKIIKKNQKLYEITINSIKDRPDKEKIIQNIDKKMKEKTSWKMKFIINEISPFICKLDQVLWSENIFISKRKLIKNFDLSYSNKTKLTYDSSNGLFMEKNKNLLKMTKINANLSFKNIMLFTKVMFYYNYLQGPEYQKDYEGLLYYTNKKKAYEAKLKQREEEEREKLKERKQKKIKNEDENEIKEENEINTNEENNNNINNEIIIENDNNKNKITIEEIKKVEENKKIKIKENNNSDSDEEEDSDLSSVILSGKMAKKEKDKISEESDDYSDDENNKIILDDLSDNKSKSNTDSKSKKFHRNKINKSKTIISQSTMDRYTINGLDVVLIDNQENSFFPFMSVSMPVLQYTSNTINTFNIVNSKFDLRFQVKIYNYVSSVWEPLIEGANCVLINLYDASDKEHTINRWKLLLSNSNEEEQKIINNVDNKNEKDEKSQKMKNDDKAVINLSISNLTVANLYPIFIHWSESYKQLNSKKNSGNLGEEQKIEKTEKKMKISNLTLYNYTGKQIISSYNDLEPEEQINEIVNEEDYMDFNHLDQDQEIIDDRQKYDIEYKDIMTNEENNDIENLEENEQVNNFGNNKINIEIKECSLREKRKEIKVDKVSTKKIYFKTNLKLSKEISRYSYIVSKVALNDKKKSVFLYSPLCFKNKTEFTINIKIECDPFPPLKDIKLSQQDLLPIPFEYIGGHILIKIGEKMTRKIKLIDFMNTNDLVKEIEFQGLYVVLYYSAPENEESLYRIIQIKTYYVIRNLLPFDIYYSVKMSKNNKFTEHELLPKNSKKNINYVSCKNDLIVNIKFLDFETINPSPLYKANKKDENSTIVKFRDKDKQEMDLLCTVIKKGKITVVLHPNSILLNHASDELLFYYGKRKAKEKENKEIPGKIDLRGLTDKKGNIFLLKNDTEKIHLKYKNFISDPFSLDAIGTETIIKCNYKTKLSEARDTERRRNNNNENNNQIIINNNEENKKLYIEFIMQNKIYLLAKDLDLYCNIIEFVPRFIIYNKLKYKLIIMNKKTKDLFIMQPDGREPFYFFGQGEETELSLNIDDKNTKWEYSFPFSINNRNLTTVELIDSDKTKRKFINISTKLFGISTVLLITEAEINTARIRIDNYSSNISIKVYQHGSINDEVYLNPCSQTIFVWPNINNKKILKFNFGFGELDDCCIMINHKTKYELLNENLEVIKGKDLTESKRYPYEENITLYKNDYTCQVIKLIISTDGEKFFIQIFDHISSEKISHKKSEFEFQAEIPKFGISLIGDNTYTTCHAKNFNAYNRIEICYIVFENILLFYGEETSDKNCNKNIQIKVKYLEIDNQISPFTNFPIVIIPNYENNPKENEDLYFFNAVYSSENNPKDNIFKILELRFLIQSFYLNLESNLLSAIINFVKNITMYLKTYLTDIHPLYLPDEENYKNHIIIKSNYSFPPWFTSLKGSDSDDDNIFLCYLETSPIDIIFSFISENKDKLFSELLMNNPILRKFTTLVSNIEQTNLTLNKNISYNIHGKKEIIMSSIMDAYKQYLIVNLMKIGVNIEILGTPLNLIKSLGTGVKDFFQKPVQGILKGPLDGAKGVYDGTKSLVKNTVGGTLNTVSKITSGFSKEILILAHDENYLNQRERKNMMHKPKTFVEGIGYGISSMMSGIYYGVTDVVRKPLEGAKKENLKGFGKGMIKGLGGLVAKPVSGVVDFFSKTAVGIKNNMTFVDEEIFQQRYPRAFYGKFKNIRQYNLSDARVIYYINTHIPGFNKKIFNEYVGSVFYTNDKKEQKLLVFGVNEFFLIEFSRFELVFKLGYKYIKDVTIGKKFLVIINFNSKINGKFSANLKIEKDTREQLSQKILKLFNEAMNVDN